MAAPSGTIWGSIVDGTSSGRKGRLGIHVSLSNTNTSTTATVQVWFWTIYSCSDVTNTFKFDIGTNITSASTTIGKVSIDHDIATGEGWNTANQTKIHETTRTISRTSSAASYKIYASLSGIEILNGAAYVNTSFTVPALQTYTISYNANGGSGAPSPQTKHHDKSLTLSTTKPTRTGYSFQGWSTSSSATNVTYTAGSSYTANANATLYAVWKAYLYSVEYNANGGSGAPASQVKTHGIDLTLSTTKPKRTNYTFLGWSTSAYATTATYTAGARYTANTPVTLYAVWELAYVKPRIANLSVSRCDSSGVETDDGLYALVKFDWSCDQTISSIVITWESTAGITGSIKPTSSGTSGSVNEIVGSGGLTTESTFSFTVTVTDVSGYTAVVATLSGTAFAIDFLAGGLGAAFGKPAELEGILDIAWKTRHLGGLLPVVLEPETDLNEVLIPNTYIGANVTNYNYSNCPVANGTFTLIVEGAGEDGQVKQTYMSCSKQRPERYSRFYYQSGWGDWFWANTDECVLYENDNGSDGTITLKHNLSDYRYIEVYFTDNNGLVGGYTKVYKPNGKIICLHIAEANGTAYSRQTTYDASGTTLTPRTSTAGYYTVNASNSVVAHTATNLIKIVRVIGRA